MPSSKAQDNTSLDHLQQRLGELERQHRADFLTPAATVTIILLISGFLPALYPMMQPIMLIWLLLALVATGLALWLNRSGHVSTAIILYIAATLIFYGGALFLTPVPHGQLSYQNFGPGNLYYFVLGVLPVFASTLLLDLPWPYVINMVVLGMTEGAIWFLPHGSAGQGFEQFSQALGGTVFLAGSVALGQVMLFVFALAIVNTLRRALVQATRAVEVEEINETISSRQTVLEADIKSLLQAHARIANGSPIRVALPSTSELYPVAISLNILVDRLSNLDRAEHELKRIEFGLGEAAQVISRLSLGDLSIQPRPTGTMVDGLLASLIQVQGQIAAWAQGISSALLDTRSVHRQTLETASDVVLAIRQLEASVAQLMFSEASSIGEIAVLARENAEQLLRLLEASEAREREVTTAINRIHIDSPTRPSAPFLSGMP